MTCGKRICGLAIAVGMASFGSVLVAQSPDSQRGNTGRPGRDQLQQPVYRVAQQPDPVTVANNPGIPGASGNTPGGVSEHPLEPALQMAYAAMTNIRNNIKDYSCTLVKQERIDGKLSEQEFMFVKVRHEPFSVYTYFLGPERLKGQEALYVAGKNNGNLLGHGVGIKKLAGTVPLPPTGGMAMQGQRYPITEIGMLNLTKRLVERAEDDKRYGECEVKFHSNAKINKRPVTLIEVIHPVPRRNFLFHRALVYVDNELNIPVRYESYDWPDRPGGQPPLLEMYTYTDIKLNNGFTDADFDEHNPKYNFH